MSDSITTWRYSVPRESDRISGWAIVFLDSIGCFAAVSDFGSWGYRWSSFGPKDFREFLIGCDAQYVRRKIAPEEEYDGEATLKAVKERICELRRTGSLDRIQARIEWNRLAEYDDLYSEFDAARWYEGARFDTSELGRRRGDPQAVAFCERVLPRLKAILQSALDSERQTEVPRRTA